MAAMHPTQEFCASRGLTLDPTSNRCVTPPASKGAETTGSLPAQTTTAGPAASPATQPPQPSAQQPRPQQSQPQQARPQQPPAQPQQPQPEVKDAGLSVPIEPGAVISPVSTQTSEAAAEFAHFVRASGYRCDSISALAPRPGGFTLACNRSTFRYAIEGKGDGWIVKAQ